MTVKPGITLNYQWVNMSMFRGNVRSIHPEADEDYITVVNMVLPISPDNVIAGEYHIEYNGYRVSIVLHIMSNVDEDPIMRLGKYWNLPMPEGVPTIPFSAFTDNRAKYPSVLAIVLFPYRLSTWIDENRDSGVRIDIDREECNVTGPPAVKEKIATLIVLNRLLKSKGLNTPIRPLRYESVTVLEEIYYKNDSDTVLLEKLTAFASETAFRNVVEEYLLSGFDRQRLHESAASIAQSFSMKDLETEEGLLSVVFSIMKDILAHHVENRRWIDAFWDGQRTITYNGKGITIPRQPKNETHIQPTLHVVLDLALSPLGIQVVRESDEGIGSLDFRCLYTTKRGAGISIGVEFKLAHHKGLEKGIRQQLPTYLKAIRSGSGIFLVMWFKDDKGRIFKEPRLFTKSDMTLWLEQKAAESSITNCCALKVSVIDASVKPSASTL